MLTGYNKKKQQLNSLVYRLIVNLNHDVNNSIKHQLIS